MSPATSDSDDPVKTIVDLLSGSPEGYGDMYGESYGSDLWPSGIQPDIIEKYWETDFQTKVNRGSVAIYVQSPELGEWDHLSAEQTIKDERQTVSAEVWAIDEDDHNAVAGDVITILEDFIDSGTAQSNTEWRKISPTLENDLRQEHIVRRTDHYVTAITIELRREVSIGT